ncbi:MAG: acyltransferase [Actinobacteria bacterium]|nr:acyltransferase [Actinomycetota bacterium]
MHVRGVLASTRPEVRVGRNVRVGRGVRWRLEPGATVIIGNACEIDDGVTIAAARGAVLRLGDGAFIGHHTTIAARESIDIGPGTFCAELVSIRDHDHDPDQPPSSGTNRVTPVTIGRDCWLATKVTVTRGVTIGDRTVVGANAVVTHDLLSGVIAVGIPASVLRHVDD